MVFWRKAHTERKKNKTGSREKSEKKGFFSCLNVSFLSTSVETNEFKFSHNRWIFFYYDDVSSWMGYEIKLIELRREKDGNEYKKVNKKWIKNFFLFS